ncbi:hypothetical protein D9619_002729 [Psilocybe cf. subviscida]|uniref:Uncharacterized protein n=1 Tax=Psilocybe cf. subviscida TaxID=2480587 RepID=A0A8H5ETU5_9AGAR|nr:hypothetical protein D9619_002729 [Psilocybe cf. subviscida]
MLARLTLGAARLLDVRIEPVNGSSHSLQDSEDEDSALIVDLDAFRIFLPTFPDNSWRDLAVSCGRAVAPMCTTVHEMFQADVDSVAHLLLDLEDTKFRDALPVGIVEPVTVKPDDVPVSQTARIPHETKKRRRTFRGKSIVISSSNPSVPTIIITLSPSQPREMSCRLPLQDSAFGELLVVPGHPTFNTLHTPPTTNSRSHSVICNWKWEAGRWHAILPPIQEQERRHIFSRPLVMKKKNRKPIPSCATPAFQST